MSRNSSKLTDTLLFKFLSLLSVVRGYNILIIVLAQYLAAIFIFSPELSLKQVVLDLDLYFIVFIWTHHLLGVKGIPLLHILESRTVHLHWRASSPARQRCQTVP